MFFNPNPDRSGFTRSREGREGGQVFDLPGGSKTRPPLRTFALFAASRETLREWLRSDRADVGRVKPWLTAALLFALLAVPQPALRAGDAAPASAERKASLDVLDGVIARFEALLARDDDAAHKAATQAKLDEFKGRRDALRQDYDASRYDELRVDLNLEYQRLASWMAPPKTPAPPAKPAERSTSNVQR